MFLFYSLVPILLQISGSTMLNLSLLTSDMWSIVIRVAAYNEKVDWLYYLAFAAVIIGLIIYSVGEKEDEDQRRANVGDEEAEHGKRPYKECPSRNQVQGVSASSSKI